MSKRRWRSDLKVSDASAMLAGGRDG